MIKSGGSARAASSASCPSCAVTTLYPAFRSFIDTTCRMCDSSSATRIVLGFAIAISQLSARAPEFNSIRELQLEPEAASLADLALHEHTPAVHRLDDLLNQRQPQARP